MNIEWVRARHEEITRYSRGKPTSTSGFWEGGEEMLARSFATNYPRIREVKTKYDQENVFRHGVSIPVAP